MEFNKRVSIISEIVSVFPGIGKTTLMKFIYLLQYVYKFHMGYRYSIYTYGPYSSTVMEDIDLADSMNIIHVKREVYDNGMSGYRITPCDKAHEMIAAEEETVQRCRAYIQTILSLFGDKSANELELLTTIIYIYSNYKANHWNTDEVPLNVHEIKPHFDIKIIQAEYERLSSLGILDQAVA